MDIDDQPIRMPNHGRSWLLALALLGLAGAAAFGMLRTGVAPLPVAGFLFLASVFAPMLATALGGLTLDRVVPFGGSLSVLAIVVFAISIELGSVAFDFYPGRGSLKGGLLYMLTFGAVPVATIFGAAIGCAIDRHRRGRAEAAELLL